MASAAAKPYQGDSSEFYLVTGRATSEWFKKDCIGSVTTWDDLVEKLVQKFYQLSDNNDEIEADEDDNPDDIAEVFKIKGNLLDFETPLCKAFNEFNYLLKIDTDIDGFCNGGELPGIVRVGCMNYFQDHKWYDELADGVLKEEAFIHKAKYKESWGDATLGVMKFYACIFGRNYGANNAGDTQDSQEQMKEHKRNKHTLSSKPTHDPSICRVRRFEMMKYSFNADDEYVPIKEHEHFDHSRTNIDEYQELFRIMDEGWLVTKAKDE
ncbi:hypothetical protein Tco_1218806 [Tanacetum coccineum]